MARILFVSVRRTFRHDDTLPDLAPWVARAWDITVAKAEECDRVVAVYEGEPVAAWRLRGTFYSEEMTASGHRRCALSLGDPLPVLLEYRDPPSLRRGAEVEERDVPDIRPERAEGR